MQQAMQQIERRDSRILPTFKASYETADEATLIAGLVDNDARAWRELQRRYDRLLVRCIAKVTRSFPSVSADDVRDIHGQLYVSLFANERAKLRAFDPTRGSSLSTYLGMLAVHCAYDWLRALRREPHREALAVAEELTSEQPDPYETVAAQERAELASRVLSGFSDRDRAFATLYFGEGLEPDEIARSMKISVKTVYSKRHKIQFRLESMVASLNVERAA